MADAYDITIGFVRASAHDRRQYGQAVSETDWTNLSNCMRVYFPLKDFWEFDRYTNVTMVRRDGDFFVYHATRNRNSIGVTKCGLQAEELE